ncbi:MAG: ABC transporter ATP-binding protein, partial [Acholeplasmataceae bacterium]|nr:ABC transporter ATP-binding protein [Acholeplasmataceae bacterium]
MAMIRLDNVSKYYKSEDNVSVGMKKISLSFDFGEFVAVTGESGSGKSTLLNVVSGLDGYEDGELYLFGEETSHYTVADWEKYRGAYVGFVFQNYNIIDSYTVLQNVMLALEIQGYDSQSKKARALELIEQVGLTSHKHHKASKLSGGQKQRAVIARALAKDCPVIVADEPTGNLDSASAKQVMELLHGISKNKLVIVVTHDYDQVKAYATRKIKMHDGEVIEDRKIKSFDVFEQATPPKLNRMRFLTLVRFALRNLFSTPRKLFFVLLMQILVIAAFTLVYTNQVASVRETGLMQSTVYPSVPPTRLLIERRDGAAMTEDELAALEANRHVDHVYPNGINFYNQVRLSIQSEYDQWNNKTIRYTDSAVLLSDRDIEGRLPEAIDEIVVTNFYNRFSLEQRVTLKTSSNYYWYDDWGFDYEMPYYGDESGETLGTFKIVGFDKRESNILYFSEAYLNDSDQAGPLIDFKARQTLSSQLMWNMTFTIDGDTYRQPEWYWDSSTDLTLLGSGMPEDPVDKLVTVSVTTPAGTELSEDYTFSVTGDTLPTTNQIYVREDVFSRLIEDFVAMVPEEYTLTARNLVSVSVSGYYDGNQLIEDMDGSIYKIYYPAN